MDRLTHWIPGAGSQRPVQLQYECRLLGGNARVAKAQPSLLPLLLHRHPVAATGTMCSVWSLCAGSIWQRLLGCCRVEKRIRLRKRAFLRVFLVANHCLFPLLRAALLVVLESLHLQTATSAQLDSNRGGCDKQVVVSPSLNIDGLSVTARRCFSQLNRRRQRHKTTPLPAHPVCQTSAHA